MSEIMSAIMSLSHKYNLHKASIENFQNVSIFIIAISSFISYLYYNTNQLLYNNEGVEYVFMYDMLLPIVGFHAIIDFFLTKSYDLKLHHSFIFGIILYNQYYNVHLEDRFIFLYPLLNTEISSIFYVLKNWLSKKSFF